MVTVPGIEHQPAYPSWDCKACGKPWPRDPTRECLTTLYDPTTLSIVMAERLNEAAGDLSSDRPSKLFDRFLAWNRGRPAS
jgi:hypothetical protein